MQRITMVLWLCQAAVLVCIFGGWIDVETLTSYVKPPWMAFVDSVLFAAWYAHVTLSILLITAGAMLFIAVGVGLVCPPLAPAILECGRLLFIQFQQTPKKSD